MRRAIWPQSGGKWTAWPKLSPSQLRVVLATGLLTVPEDFRLTAYVVLSLNFAGSAGDVVEAFLVMRQPRDALVKDDGDEVHVFLPLQLR